MVLLFGIQVSVLIVAVFTAFISYQFRLREKKRDLAHSEITKSYNEVYSPIKFLLKEINEEPSKEEKLVLIDNFFNQYGLSGSKGQLIGASEILHKFFELNALYKAFKHDQNAYEDKFIQILKSFEVQITNEFWDAHDIIYKEHIRYKKHHFNPVRSLFLDLLATIKLMTELATSIVFIAWIAILTDIVLKLHIFNEKSVAVILVLTVMVALFYSVTFIYYKTFYKPTNNRYKMK